jgi:hypothetical protein
MSTPPELPEIDTPTPLLGGLSPAVFMRRHWQKKPLLVRQAWPGVQPPLARARQPARHARVLPHGAQNGRICGCGVG